MNVSEIDRQSSNSHNLNPANKWPRILVAVLITMFAAAQSMIVWNHFRFGYDDSIYIGMARYFSSFTAAGYFEHIRPIVLPLVLGAISFIGLDLLVFSKVLAIVTAVATIGLTYKITERLSDGVSGLFAALIVMGSPTFFQNAHMVLTDIPSVFLSLVSFLFFFRASYFQAGFFASLAFMTRFPHGILILSYGLVFVYACLKPGQAAATIKQAGRFLLAYAIPVSGFMLFNLLRYPNAGIKAPLLPLVRAQMVVIDNGRWMNQGDWTYYLTGLFHDHVFYLAALAGCWMLIRSGKFRVYHFAFPLLTIILFFIYFSRLDLKYIRYIISFSPYLALFAGIGLHYLGNKIRIPRIQLIIGVMLFMYGIFNVKLTAENQPDGRSAAEAIHAVGYKGRVITSTPYVIAHLENKLEPVLVPEHFLMVITANRTNLVVYSPASYYLVAGDKQTVEMISRIEAELNASYEQMYRSGDDNYPFELYRPKP